MASKEIIAGQAAVFVSLRDKLFRDQVRNLGTLGRQVGTSFTQIGAGLTAFGAGATAAVLRASNVFASYGDAVDKAALRTGLSAEAVSELGFAAELAGSDIQTLEAGLRRAQAGLLDAAEGGQTSIDAFDRIGLSVEQLLRLTPEQQFEAIADGVSNIADPTVRAAAAMDILGKSGQKLVPLLSGGAEAIRSAREEARRLGISITQEDAAGAAALTDGWTRVSQTFRGVSLQIGAAVAPSITSLTDRITASGSAVVNFIRDNRELVATLAGAAAGIATAGSSLTVAGLAIRAASSGFATIGQVATTLPLVGGAVAALLSPLGLMAAGAAAAGVAFISLTGTGQEMGRVMTKVFGDVLGIATDTFGEIVRAVSGGDLSGAISAAWNGVLEATDTAWLGIQLVALEAVESIRQQFPGLVANITLAWNQISALTTAAWNGISGVVSEVWGSISEFVLDSWGQVSTGVAELTGSVAETLAGYFGDIGGYWSDITDGMFDSWADFTASVQTLWADAGTFLLRKTLEVTAGMLDTFADIAEFLAGDNFVSGGLRDITRDISQFRDNVVQGGQDRREVIERQRQEQRAAAEAIQQRQVTQFQSQIAELRKELAIASVDNLQVPSEVINSIENAKPDIDLDNRTKFRAESTSSFSARAASLLGGRLSDQSATRQRTKMVDLLGRIASNTVKEARQVV